jgi:hypothetical protein
MKLKPRKWHEVAEIGGELYEQDRWLDHWNDDEKENNEEDSGILCRECGGWVDDGVQCEICGWLAI